MSKRRERLLVIGLLGTITLSGITPGQKLVQASRLGNIADAQKILKAKPETSLFEDAGGRNPLHWAALNGHVEIVKLLLADVDKKTVSYVDKQGNTPLCLAAMENNASIIQLLLANNANPTFKGRDGNTPLHNAAKNKKDIAVTLLYTEDRSSIKNNEKETPDDLAKKAGTTLMTLFESGRKKLLEMEKEKIGEMLRQGQPKPWIQQPFPQESKGSKKRKRPQI